MDYERIYPHEVKQAFDSTGLIPIRGDYDPIMGVSGFLFALSRHTGYGYRHSAHHEAVCISEFITKMNLSPSYLSSFTSGWNGEPKQGDFQAWKDGFDAWQAM